MPDSVLESSWQPTHYQRVIPCFKNHVAEGHFGDSSKTTIIIGFIELEPHVIPVLKSYIYHPQRTTAASLMFNVQLVSAPVLNSNMRWSGRFPWHCSRKRIISTPSCHTRIASQGNVTYHCCQGPEELIVQTTVHAFNFTLPSHNWQETEKYSCKETLDWRKL